MIVVVDILKRSSTVLQSLGFLSVFPGSVLKGPDPVSLTAGSVQYTGFAKSNPAT
ncbi:hypothetical protein F2Q70_00039341 [Brassica cretica]|uniref:Uncharacterized protein n=1 Tax=Brassica cretica TaxID=69181 RepID=A0A8S9MN93_BRACR|nr:hypothetical protein F2Q70_00039341 [Brassica cretica]KAF2619957.1 hypothetical protein F2Q68_00040034 [Brassica cretica]